jgi:putative FmdB family regulatory protein
MLNVLSCTINPNFELRLPYTSNSVIFTHAIQAMPIYAYRCDACQHSQDLLQKMSDPVLTICPQCNQATFKKQLTAAGFHLKGSGWYVTDFKENSGGGNKKATEATPEGETPKIQPNTAAEITTTTATQSTDKVPQASTTTTNAATPTPSSTHKTAPKTTLSTEK